MERQFVTLLSKIRPRHGFSTALPARNRKHCAEGVTIGPYSCIYGSMKTTFELPDAMARQAKILAAERRVTLRELVLQGLEHVWTEKQVTARSRAKKR